MNSYDRRKLLAEETGTCYSRGKISVGLVYPNSYFVGMSNLGFQNVYARLNSIPGISCERIFLSQKITSLERGKTPASFEILAFSIPFELDYLNVLRILDLAGIPLRKLERKDKHPLIVAGGFAPSSNPEPLFNFIDAFLIGEGEGLLEEFMERYKELKGRRERSELLAELSDIKGVYVPAIPQRSVLRRRVENIDEFETVSKLFTGNTEFADMFLIEVSRSCPRGCRFCASGSVGGTFRVRKPERVLVSVKEGLKKRKRIGLISLDLTAYPHLDAVLEGIVDMGGNVSFTSFRPGVWKESMLKALRVSDQKTVSIASEAGSDKLRKMIGKDISSDEIIEQAKQVVGVGAKSIKLYFMIGLPAEDDSDMEAIVELVGKIRDETPSSMRITVSVNPFVPKAGTAFQWAAMEESKVLNSRLSFLKKELRKLHLCNLVHESIKWSLWQGILCRGDRKLGEIIELTCRMDGNWMRAFREMKMDPQSYLKVRNQRETFPWDFIIQGRDKSSLLKEYTSRL